MKLNKYLQKAQELQAQAIEHVNVASFDINVYHFDDRKSGTVVVDFTLKGEEATKENFFEHYFPFYAWCKKEENDATYGRLLAKFVAATTEIK